MGGRDLVSGPSVLELGALIAKRQNEAPGEEQSSRGFLPGVELDAKDLGVALRPGCLQPGGANARGSGRAEVA